MSFFEDASLVLIPSAQKTSKIYSVKPTDGTGDLTFTRSNDTATRVGPDGLIQKVRTNVLLQSNSFDTTWTNLNTTETGGQAGYDGTNNAWLLSKTGASGRILQSVSNTGVQTFSVYVKGGTDTWCALFAAGPEVGKYFNLSTGAVGSNFVGAPLDAKIEAVGGGWYRVSMAISGSITQVRIYPAEGDEDTSGTSGTIYIQDAQLEAGDIATDYIATTTAAVSVGPVANVPRLDYLNSSCPRLLLEPQRTNLATYSEQLDNAAWVKTEVSVTANAAISPDGYTNADKLIPSTNNTGHFIASAATLFTSGTTYTWSVYAKKDGYDYLRLAFPADAFPSLGRGASFNLNTGVVGQTQSGVTATIQEAGNGYYRCSITATATITFSTGAFFNSQNADSATTINFAGDGTSGALIYGAQMEAGAYETSLIPTLGAAVTRGADAAYKTGIGSLFGANAGTIYFETTYYPEANTGSGERWVYAQGNTSSDYVRLWQDVVGGSKRIRALVGTGGVQVANLSVAATSLGLSDTESGSIKFAFAYENDRFQMYVNGINAALDTSGTAPTLTEINFNNTFQTLMPLAQCLVFPTALTNAQLAELTTI